MKSEFKPGDRKVFLIPEDARISTAHHWPKEWGDQHYSGLSFTVINYQNYPTPSWGPRKEEMIGVIDRPDDRPRRGDMLVLEYCTASGDGSRREDGIDLYQLWKIVEEEPESSPS